ncbi:MAG: VOC family protein [Fimbriiglobus sp.]|jgi:hypothetical protein|nr:VOC family protein [Fimbriiglobus sp.]
MQLYMTELGVSDLSVAVKWWTTLLGVLPILQDGVNGFALFETPEGRVALKEGSSTRGLIHFRVTDLLEELFRLSVSSELKQSDEGYLRAKLHDPDGNVVVLFQWLGERSA